MIIGLAELATIIKWFMAKSIVTPRYFCIQTVNKKKPVSCQCKRFWRESLLSIVFERQRNPSGAPAVAFPFARFSCRLVADTESSNFGIGTHIYLHTHRDTKKNTEIRNTEWCQDQSSCSAWHWCCWRPLRRATAWTRSSSGSRWTSIIVAMVTLVPASPIPQVKIVMHSANRERERERQSLFAAFASSRD